jgi:hypothetical protein
MYFHRQVIRDAPAYKELAEKYKPLVEKEKIAFDSLSYLMGMPISQ